MLAPSRSPNGVSRRVSIVYLGILAFLTSATSMALPQGVQAQIPVTGGRTAGDGAFFVPDSGNTVLFDTSPRFLRLETPNGVTVNSRFTPNGGSLNPTTGVPQGGETGILSGTLSGRAFTADGTPVFFQGITTNLNFTLNTFDANRVFPGTLITPTNSSGAPLVFLQTTGATLSTSSQNFAAIPGSLHIGQFSANLSGGSIDLPSDVQFARAATDNISLQGQEFAATANTTFELEGRGDGVTTVNRSNNQNGSSEIAFDTDNGSTKFRIEGTVGGNSREGTSTTVTTTSGQNTTALKISGNSFELEGNITGPLNFTVSGVSPTENSSEGGSGTLRGDTSYQLSGSGRGTTTLDAKNGNVSFYSGQSETNVSISVGDADATPGGVRSLNATGTGEAAFNVSIGLPATGISSTKGGNIFNANPTPTNTDFGSGFFGVEPGMTTNGGNSQLPDGGEPPPSSGPSGEQPTVNIPATPASPTLPGSFLPDDSETLELAVEPEPAGVTPGAVVTPPSPNVPTLPNAPLPAEPVVSPTSTTVASSPSTPVAPSLPSAPTPEPVAPPVVVTPEPVAPPVVATPEPVTPPVVVTPEPVAPPVAVIPEPVAVVPTPDAEAVPTVDPLEQLIEEQRSAELLSRSASTFISAFRQTPSRQYVPVGPRSRIFPGLGGVREVKNGR